MIGKHTRLIGIPLVSETSKAHDACAAGLFGAALIYGDGAIAPAILFSRRSKLLEYRDARLEALCAAHRGRRSSGALSPSSPLGTARIGKAFGFRSWLFGFLIALLRFSFKYSGIQRSSLPDPLLDFTIFCPTVAASRFGRGLSLRNRREHSMPIWGMPTASPAGSLRQVFVLPSLFLVSRQSAIVIDGASTADNIFYQLCPRPLLIPFVLWRRYATIIAGQSIITGAFSMTRQAIFLEWLPRSTDRATCEKGYGQIRQMSSTRC